MFLHKMKTGLTAIVCCLLVTACKEEIMKPLPGSSNTPAVVTDITVANGHGEAKIMYKVPADPGLLYVEAKWTHKGVERNTKASYYSDTLTLEGFGDTSEYNVQIYSINKSEQRSAPVNIKVKPLTPPVAEVFKTLTVRPDFGGLNIGFINETRGNVVIDVITPDSMGVMAPADAFYTNLYRDSFSVRGYKAEPRTFGIYVKDRWGNFSDTMYTTLTPLFELQLNKALFKELIPIGGDVNNDIYSAAYPMRNLWDNTNSIYVTKQGLGVPESFSIDLGVRAKLSRMKYFQRQSTAFYFTSGTPEYFEVYGSNNPTADGNWNSWTLLRNCVSRKPSGLPLGVVTADDISYALAGEDFDFPIDAQAYRYLRFKVTKSYGNGNNITFAELTFWGQY